MKKNISTLILKSVIVLFGVMVLGFAFLVIPDETPMEDMKKFWPFFLAVYSALIPFFIALFQALRLLSFVDQNQAFSVSTVKSLRTIKYSGIAISLLFGALLPFMFIVAQIDDAPGFAAIGMFVVLASIVVATGAAVLGKLIQNAIEIKSENDLTV